VTNLNGGQKTILVFGITLISGVLAYSFLPFANSLTVGTVTATADCGPAVLGSEPDAPATFSGADPTEAERRQLEPALPRMAERLCEMEGRRRLQRAGAAGTAVALATAVGMLVTKSPAHPTGL
jgi:hypothetical protein